MGRKPNTKSIPDELCRQYERGEINGVGIAKQLGWNSSSVYFILRRQGVAIGKQGRRQAELTVPKKLLKDITTGKLTLSEVATRLRISRGTLRNRLLETEEYREHLQKGKAMQVKQHEQRCLAMLADYQKGKTLREIGEQHGISHERVRQLISEVLPAAPTGHAIALCRWCNAEMLIDRQKAMEVWCPKCWQERKAT